MTTTYCVRADIESLVGIPAVLACIDDDHDGVESAGDTLNITAAIERAAVEMNGALDRQYTLADLSDNDWCKWCNANLAAMFLFARRGNPAPSSVIEAAQAYRERLAEIMYGRQQVPEQNPSFEHTPAVSNFKPEIGKYDNPIRVVREESTGAAPNTPHRRNVAGQGGYW